MDAAPSPRTPREPVPSVPPPSRLGFGFVSPLVSPARKLASTHPSLFSPFGRETMPAQSSTGFLAQHPRLFPRGLQGGLLRQLAQLTRQLKTAGEYHTNNM